MQERLAEEKEKADERAERRFLAEETQETKRRDAKAALARAEEAKYDTVEKEAERVAKVAQEEEAELKVCLIVPDCFTGDYIWLLCCRFVSRLYL